MHKFIVNKTVVRCVMERWNNEDDGKKCVFHRTIDSCRKSEKEKFTVTMWNKQEIIYEKLKHIHTHFSLY